MDILGLTFAQFLSEVEHRFGKGHYHAAAAYRQIFGGGNNAFSHLPEFSQSPRLAHAFAQWLRLDPAPVIKIQKEGNLTKFVSRLKDGHTIESVSIPMANHQALCISSQVGCRMGCRFCETGQMGLRRNLTAAEIVAQVFAARFVLKTRVRNLVFMGMGEPFDNFEAVAQAILVFSDQRGFDIAPKHITVSTAGLIDGIEKLARLNLPQLKLAVSLNASDDKTRSELMPVNRKYPMDKLKAALLGYPLPKDGAVFIEYVLIKGANDGRAHACRLARYLEGLNAKVNLIGYNPRRNSPFAATSEADLIRFRDYLIEEKLFVRLRSSKGRRIMAACGQLGAAEYNVKGGEHV